MDFEEAKQILELSDDQIAVAKQYKEAKEKETEAKLKLDLVLTGEKLLTKYRTNKKNLGIEMAILMMVEEKGEELRQAYCEFHSNKAKADSARMLIEAYSGKIIAMECLMKYQLKGEM